jgi:hypothetical protein
MLWVKLPRLISAISILVTRGLLMVIMYHLLSKDEANGLIR